MIHWTELRVDQDPVTGEFVGGEIVFSHVDDKTGVVRHFAIERIVADIPKMETPPPVIVFPTDLNFARFMLAQRGIEPHRYDRITPQDVIAYPIIMAKMPGVGRDTPDDHLIIDGNHRYCKAVLQWGWKEMQAYELSEDIWSKYLVSVPDWLNEKSREDLANQHVKPINSRIK